MIGQFLSPDSVEGNAQGLDPYSYVGGNPESRTDPTGNRQWAEDGSTGVYNPTTNSESVYTPGNQNQPPTTTVYYEPPVLPCQWGCYSAPPAHHTTPHPAHHAAPASHKNTALDTAKNVALAALDAATGIPSIIHDIQVLADGNAGGWEKAMAAGDLAFNVGSDAMLLMGVGELMRGAAAVAHIGADVAVHEGEDLAVHEGADVAAQAVGDCLSFSAATVVTTALGKQAISTLQPGEKVWAYNSDTRKMEQEPIVHVWVNHDNDLVDLTITKTAQSTHGQATKQTSEVIHTNKKHPFLTVEQGFLPVGQITLGMHVVEADGHAGVITGWKLVAGAMTMYNLEVAHDHTFVVGVGQWVVHNCGYSEKLLSNIDEHWHPGSYSSAEESFTKHFAKHGEEVGASTAEQYMNKALGFQQNLRRAASKPVDGFVKGAQRFIKLGKYIDVAPDERIISFGTR